MVLFQLVAGQLPFTGADNVLMHKILNDPTPRLSSIRQDLPASLEPIVDRALAKSLDDRYSTAEEMAADLTAVIAELRQEQVKELLPEAKRLVDAEDFTRAANDAPPTAEDRQQARRGQGVAGRDSAPASTSASARRRSSRFACRPKTRSATTALTRAFPCWRAAWSWMPRIRSW